MAELEKLLRKVAAYRAKRGWQKSHRPKDLALLVMLEVADLLQDAQKGKDFEKKYKKIKKTVTEELATALYWVLYFCSELDIDIISELEKKIRSDSKKSDRKNKEHSR